MKPNGAGPRRAWSLKQIIISMAVMVGFGLPGLVPLGSSQATETAASSASVADAAAEAVGAALTAAPKTTESLLDKLLPELLAILILLAVIGVVVLRLPKIDLGHSDAYRRRRVMNWLPLGLTYSFLYMARYNLNKATEAFEVTLGVMEPSDFSFIFMVGTLVYGFSFVVNGPITDKIGGKRAILIGAGGSALANVAMGIVTMSAVGGGEAPSNPTPIFAVLYGINMYFQSFGAVAIVKVNAPWFHVRERGVFGAIFGVLISLGVYFAYDWGALIVKLVPLEWVFFIPAIILGVFWTLDVFFVKDRPSQAGFEDFHTGDATAGDDSPPLPVIEVFKKMLTNKIILIIAGIEFCSGFLRQAIMQYYPKFIANTTPPDGDHGFVFDHWGMFLCAAGILGGMFAGIISDRVFDSRRGPVASVLYGGMLIGGAIAIFTFTGPGMAIVAVAMSLCVIGVHGMLSGTASMDFGGAKNVGIAVGIIDGFVYLGTAVMAGTYSLVLPDGDAKHIADNWIAWPVAMVPMALIGLYLATKIWNAKPQPKGASAH